ncbi:hypothetical protein RJ639_017284 [Escallonia herrerae]|uniref:DM2 domain-containing protein n=1 Tax=Escallonia herrerae TaxID=1293975 RepID=A0AA88VE55_9ASTE|nr:hypothetical protein RJ639_017284 [Escallonia herrerae]
MLAAPNAIKKASSIRPLVDAEMENRMLRLMEDSTSSFNMEDFVKKQKIVSSSSYSQNFVLDKSITMGKVERSVNAIRAALKKLEEGGTIEDAQAVCEPEVLNQIIRWKRKLSVYLAPFILGMRYTSFGRHFTKVDKLKEIVDRLHCYVQDGDMIVDFCCGSNDFSCLMKEKLEKMGKRCSFKNYDLITPKNDFSFEKRDWMSVHTGELPAGSRMIMGLNPPFGVQASLANKFIDKALSFKPKLLILIVPKETRRQSFYLPGSVDVHDQQLDQWNMDPPPLYLWSHPVWTGRHKAIAQESGHFNEVPKNVHIETNNVKGVVSNYLMEEAHDCYGDFSNFGNSYADICSILDDIPEESDYTPGNTVVPGEKEAGPSVTDDETRMQFNGRGGNLA